MPWVWVHLGVAVVPACDAVFVSSFRRVEGCWGGSQKSSMRGRAGAPSYSQLFAPRAPRRALLSGLFFQFQRTTHGNPGRGRELRALPSCAEPLNSGLLRMQHRLAPCSLSVVVLCILSARRCHVGYGAMAPPGNPRLETPFWGRPLVMPLEIIAKLAGTNASPPSRARVVRDAWSRGQLAARHAVPGACARRCGTG